MCLEFFTGRDNDAVLTLQNNGAVTIPGALTKLELKYDGGSLNSVDDPTVIIPEANAYRLRLGLSALAAGVYKLQPIAYGSGFTNGIVWGDPLEVKIVA